MSQLKIKIERISEGFIATEVIEESKISKSFIQNSDDIILRIVEDPEFKKELDALPENAPYEITISLTRVGNAHGEIHRRLTEKNEIKNLKKEVIQPADKFIPQNDKPKNLVKPANKTTKKIIIPDNYVPSVVNSLTALSTKNLEKIKFTELINNSGLSDKQLAKICGIEKVPSASTLKRNLRLNQANLKTDVTRVYLTRLARWFNVDGTE